VEAALAAATAAWAEVAGDASAADALRGHGVRVARILLAAGGNDLRGVEAAVALAGVLHEIGRHVADRGHVAVRGARWVAVHLDRILPGASAAERRLAGELILFHRHRGALPPELSRPSLIDRFRQVEAWDRAGGTPPAGLPPSLLTAALEAEPRGLLGAALRRSDLRELLHHPIVHLRRTRIRRPDR